ncbi:MAG: RNA polymerase sigma factor [Planctomycetota bacterium]|nr:RNA polymerase sigma factor [Planctomycetaceae bacterium]MDQ3329959.1 RNA polymerase sigma factor [Planctomycetota bacterium]
MPTCRRRNIERCIGRLKVNRLLGNRCRKGNFFSGGNKTASSRRYFNSPTDSMSEPDDRATQFLRHLEPLQGALEAYCRRSIHDASHVEDVLQGAVADAFRDFHRYAEGTNFRAWIFRYLNLEILEQNRRTNRNQREQVFVAEPTAADLSTPNAPPPGELLDDLEPLLDDCDDALAAALRDLRDRERSVLLLRAVGELRYAEIAEVLDVPVGTVMSSLSRARSTLKTRLTEHCLQQGLLRSNASRSSDVPRDGTEDVRSIR